MLINYTAFITTGPSASNLTESDWLAGSYGKLFMVKLFRFSSIFYSSIRLYSKLPNIKLIESELKESFILGSGPGGQAINKTRSCVQLTHLPTGLMVQTQRFRELELNRKEARKLLTLKLDKLLNKENSVLELKAKKLRKQKADRKRKADKKYKQ